MLCVILPLILRDVSTLFEKEVIVTLQSILSIGRTNFDLLSGLPSIISMACSEDQNDQRAAMSTLRGICAIPENRRPVMEAKVNDALALGTRAIDVDVR